MLKQSVPIIISDIYTGPSALIAGHGADLWSRVTTVASKLTVNVNQAWQKSILADGEGEHHGTLKHAEIYKPVVVARTQRLPQEKNRVLPKQ